MSRTPETLDRILCGTDGTPAADVAVRQALTLAPAASRLVVASVAPIAAAAHPGNVPALRIRAHAALMTARRIADPRKIEALEFEGDPASALLAAAARLQATLLVVGAHPGGRVRGVLEGSVASKVIHRARCSVLVTRPPSNPEAWPSRVIAGTDASSCGRHAVDVAQHLSAAAERELVVVAAAGVRPEPDRLATALPADVRLDDRDAVTALCDVATPEDLLVVGSRGLAGVRSLGSVSEKLAHHAPGSVLIVRSEP
jgi:nucleotide-binding universal stress UspA family protein